MPLICVIRHAILVSAATAAAVLLACACSAEETPPSIDYPSSRTSTKNINVGRIFVGVDQGIEFNGVKVYLSLTSDLLGVDTASDKTLWHHEVGAFWSGMAIKQIEVHGEKVWAVELHGSPDTDQFDKHYDYYELKSGKKIDLPAPKPSGVSLLPIRIISCGGAFAKPFHALITTQANFDTFLKRAYGPSRRDIGA